MADDEETEITEAGKHDDASFLLELHQSIKGHSFRQMATGSVFSSADLYRLITLLYRQVLQLVELVNDRLADLYALAQGEVLDDVRFPLF